MLQVDCPSIHRGSLITWCGEAPGEDECWKKQGFAGKAGDLARKICAGGGVDFGSVNLTNVTKRRPLDNNFKKAFYEGSKPTVELLAWYDNLADELRSHRPNVIVACGNEALKALVGLDQIIRRQGSVYECKLVPGLKVVAMQHPSAILHSKKWSDIYLSSRIVRKVVLPESKSSGLSERGYAEVLEPSMYAIKERFAWAISEQARWVIDIETRGGGVACVGVGFSQGRWGEEVALVVPIETTTGPWFSLENERGFWMLLQNLANSNPNLVLQNAPFDLGWLLEYGFVPQDVLMDTQTAHHLLYAELAKKLEVLNWFYPTGIPYYKDEGKTWGKKDPDERTWKYCGKDLVSELRVSYQEEAELKERGLWETYRREFIEDIGLALEMQHRGFPVRDADLAWTRGVVEGELSTIQDRLNGLAGWRVNVGSPKQVPKLLYEQLRFPKLYGKSNADEDALVPLKSWIEGQKPQGHTKKCESKPCKHLALQDIGQMRQVLDCVMHIRKLSKAKSSYLADRLYMEVK